MCVISICFGVFWSILQIYGFCGIFLSAKQTSIKSVISWRNILRLSNTPSAVSIGVHCILLADPGGNPAMAPFTVLIPLTCHRKCGKSMGRHKPFFSLASLSFPYPTSSLPKISPCFPGSRWIAFWLQRAKMFS